MNAAAQLFAWTLASVLLDLEGFAALVPTAAWARYAAQTGMSWEASTVALPGATAVRFASEKAPGVVPVVYDGAPPLDAAQRFQRSALRFAQTEGRPVALVVAEALRFAFEARYAEALLGDAPAPANDAAPVAAVPSSPSTGEGEGERAEAPKNAPPGAPKPANSLGAFLKLHPRLLDVLAEMARAQLAAGAVRVSVNALFEALRADVDRYREACGGALPPPSTNGGTWRLNNTHRAAVARLLAAHAPDLGTRIDMRKSRADYDPAVTGRIVTPKRTRRAS